MEFVMIETNQDLEYMGFNIDQALKKQFKRICLEKDENMSEVMIRLIAQYVKNSETKQHQRTA